MIQWTSVTVTHRGKVRRINEDSVLASDTQGFWVVADGMGGHSAGDYASQYLCARLLDQNFSGVSLTEGVSLFRKVIENSNQHLLAYAREHDFSAVGSTVVGLRLTSDGVGALHWVGDSRLYQYQAAGMVQLSHDHSLVQELVDLGELSAEEAENFPSKNVITRAIGANNTIFCDTQIVDVDQPTLFLLCSDGLSNEVPDDALRSILAHALEQIRAVELKTAQKRQILGEAAEQLLDAALLNDAADNISFILVEASPQ